MSLMDLLLDSPSMADQIMPMLQGGVGSTMPAPGGSGPVGSSGGSPSHWESVAQRMAANKFGYSPQEFNKLDSIISRESNWDPNALNEGSGAYGIPQILPSAHPDVQLQGDPRGQIRWLLNYIEDRYGGVNNALDFKDREGWY